MNCLRCERPCTRDEVDVGVGMMPASDWGCDDCQWFEGEPPNADARWWTESDKAIAYIAYKATTNWERETLIANGFKADGRPMVYRRPDADGMGAYLAATVQGGGV